MADVGDRMFCHACGGVWLRRDHGLECPHCHSEFTEIIEIPPDTEEEVPDPPTSVPEDRSAPPRNPWADHNPWDHDNMNTDTPDWGSGNGFRHHTYRSPDGRFTFSSTTYTRRGSSGQQMPVDPLMPMVRGLDTIFHGLADTYRQTEYRQPNERDSSPGLWRTDRQNQGSGPNGSRIYNTSFDIDMNTRSNGGVGSEFHTTGGLHPRDADGPQPMGTPLRTLGEYVLSLGCGEIEKVTDLYSILELFRADFGNNGPPGGGPGVRVMTGPNPIAILSTLLNLDRHGDAVYSQEELDRVISQLIDQNARGTAPPPAAPNEIQSLPKKKVDQEMLGSEGKAECSICMDPVELGTEVTVLPCKHWFHYNCIEMWLSQHNTCPHCRRGINIPAGPVGSSDNPVVINSSPETSPRRPSGAAPEHSGQSPPRWYGPGPETGGQEQDQGQSSRNDNQGGGFAGWVRSHFGGGNQ
ncbi:RING finger domain protein [Aspergillus flavus AF70]|nr:RING finger domain protein [Aspergillus flavus AF70]